LASSRSTTTRSPNGFNAIEPLLDLARPYERLNARDRYRDARKINNPVARAPPNTVLLTLSLCKERALP
jgi:hypothetical protein